MDFLALLFVLGICSSLASGNVKPTPPEDLDGSGDDEDFSGSGMDSFLEELDSKGSDVSSTTVSPLVPTVTQVSIAQKPDIAVEEETEENVTQHTHTTKPHDPIEDIFAFEREPFAEEGTTPEPTTQQKSTVESVNDVKKHHHHTTKPVTTLPAKVDVVEEATSSSAEVEKPFVAPEETTTSTPDEGDVDDLVQEVTSTPDNSVQHVDHPETTSGLTSTSYAGNEETTAGPADVDEIPVFVEKTTVTDDTHTHKHHHHHPHHTTTSTTEMPLGGSDILIETTGKSDHLEPEDDQDQQEATTTPSEDKHHDHKHHHHKPHHHTTTSEATRSTVSEQFIVHAHEPKGRRVNVPPAETTTVVPVLSEDDEPVGSTVQYNHSASPTQDEDNQDSAEVDSGDGPLDVEDIFFEQATVPLDNSDRIASVPGDGSAGASHGIMERKELLAGIIAGGLAGLVFAASLVAFVFYRMKKKDEGSYSLEEPKQSNGGYQKPREQREFYA